MNAKLLILVRPGNVVRHWQCATQYGRLLDVFLHQTLPPSQKKMPVRACFWTKEPTWLTKKDERRGQNRIKGIWIWQGGKGTKPATTPK
jgi:hypothetical protein